MIAQSPSPKTPIAFADRDFDKLYSFFWWKIYLNPDYTGPNGETNRQDKFIGYSARVGVHEPRIGPTKSLIGCIDRIFKPYFYIYEGSNGPRAITWEIRQRLYDIIHADDPVCLVMDHQNFSLGDELVNNYELLHYLNRLYKSIRDGVHLKRLKPGPELQRSQDDFLDVDIQFQYIGKSEDALMNYIERLIHHKHPPGAITAFYKKYRDKYCR